MTADRAPDVSDPLIATLEAQQQALITGDTGALAEAGQSLSDALASLRLNGAADAGARDRLAAARRQLIVNAGLLQRSAARNQRALNAIFEPAATYGLPGTSGLATPSRAMHRA